MERIFHHYIGVHRIIRLNGHYILLKYCFASKIVDIYSSNNYTDNEKNAFEDTVKRRYSDVSIHYNDCSASVSVSVYRQRIYSGICAVKYAIDILNNKQPSSICAELEEKTIKMWFFDFITKQKLCSLST